MYGVRQRSVAALLILWVTSLACLGHAPIKAQAAGADSSLVLAALHVLETDYVKPVDATKLLNATIAGLRKAAHQGAETLPDIPTGLQEAQAIGAFRQEFGVATKVANVSEADLAYAATREMLASLHDSRVHYFDATAFKLRRDLQAGRLQYQGIGIELKAIKGNSDANELYVVNVSPGSPAAGAGLQRLDRITGVNGTPVSPTASSDDVASQIRGPGGSSVSLTIQRGGQPVNVSIVRGPIQFLGVEARTIQPGVAYAKLYSFSTGMGDKLRGALKPLMAQGPIRAVILDLRGSSSGVLREAEGVAGVFLPPQTMLARVLQRTGNPAVLVSKGDPLLPKAALTILADRFTAASAEIVVEGLKNAHRATIVGEKTAGELGVAADRPLPVGGMSVTVSQVEGPQSEQIEGVGIAADTHVELSIADMGRGVDTQLDAALKTVGK